MVVLRYGKFFKIAFLAQIENKTGVFSASKGVYPNILHVVLQIQKAKLIF